MGAPSCLTNPAKNMGLIIKGTIPSFISIFSYDPAIRDTKGDALRIIL